MTHPKSRLAAAGSLLLALAAPARAVVYGTDDRVDVWQETDPALQSLAQTSTAALIEPWNLRFPGGGAVEAAAAPLGAWDNYCVGTPFLEESTASTCGAVLIDGDLVLTASHCLTRVPSCRDYDYVFGYVESAPGTLGALSRAQVYGCRTVAVSVESPPDSDTHVDYAVVQLDRPVDASLTPVTLGAADVLSAGQAVVTIGFPSGLPVKLDPSAVLDPRAATLDYFTLASDTFEGSSGSGVYDADRRLVGLFARGTADYVDRGSCRAVRVVTTPDAASAESATYVAAAVAALCAAGWPSQRLCGVAPACGDGICSPPAEQPANCPGDCSSPVCGDGLCETSEWDSCAADCGDGRPARLPDAWYCQPEWYADGQTCDCDCGAPDPDCSAGGSTRDCDSLGPGGRQPPSGGSGGCAVAPPEPGAPGRPGGAAFVMLAIAGRRRKKDGRQPSSAFD